MRAACASCGSGGSGFAAARVTGPFCFERKQLVAGQCVCFLQWVCVLNLDLRRVRLGVVRVGDRSGWWGVVCGRVC